MSEKTYIPDTLAQIVDSNILRNASHLFVEQWKKTNPISDTYYQYDEHTYSLLEKLDETKMIISNNSIDLVIGGLICCMKFKNLPMSQYTLAINNHNVATGIYHENDCVFDFLLNLQDILW